MRATYLVEKINFQKKFAELGFLFNKLKVSSLSQILFHEVLSRGVVSLRKIRSWQNTLVLFDCLFCRLPCTTWVPRMATTLTRIRGGEKSKRSRRWKRRFWHLLNLLAARTCRMKRWGRPGWTWCSSASSPASSSSSTWSTGSASSGYTRHRRRAVFRLGSNSIIFGLLISPTYSFQYKRIHMMTILETSQMSN